ncbi:MAG: hypothetical protein ACRCV9_16220 [Burkholderiaceae bacterium]
MPKVAELIDERRVECGKAWVDACIADGMKGLPDRFFALERVDANTIKAVGAPMPMWVSDVGLARQLGELLLGGFGPQAVALFPAKPGVAV